MNKIALLALIAGTSAASADLAVTEIYAGLTGEDGTPDWFELTWTGVGTFDTGSLFFEDDSADPLNAGSMTSFVLNSGESAVFLLGGGAADITDFTNIWGSVANLGVANGGGNLGQGGDGVFLFDGNSAGANLIATASFPAYNGDELATFEIDAMGNASFSVAGVNGAYESNAFFNDNIGGANNEVTLIGSPGVVPTPGAAALLGLGGLMAGRRRR